MDEAQEEIKKPCAFCSMFTEDDENIIDIEPLNPVTPGHRLIIHRQHTKDFSADAGIFSEVARYASDLGKWGKDFNLITSKGELATQSVFHLHVHLIPRTKNDGLNLPWTNQTNK